MEDMINALNELLEHKVLYIDEEGLHQKRMVKDGKISEARSKAGKKGGGNPLLFKQKSKQTSKQRDKQITENEYEYENDNINSNKEESVRETIPVEKTEKEKEFDRFNDWIDDNAKYIRKIRDQITFQEYCRLTERYNGEQMRKVLMDISNYKDAPKKYVSVNLTFQNWAKREYKNG